MANMFSSLLLTLHIITSHAKNNCLSSCTSCKNAASCSASIDRGNRCKWEDAICQEIITSKFNTYQIIPLPATTEIDNTLNDRQECICNEAYFSSWINSDESCECYNGMKALRVQYTGTESIESITFYHNSYRHYEDCIFTNIKPNEIIQCTSFPYSQFVSKVYIKVNGVHECSSSIDTTCSADILDTVPANCDMLQIVGWIDEAGYVCKAPQLQTATQQPSETGNFHKATPKNRKTSGGDRRRMRVFDSSDSSSASRSSSGSSGDRKPWSKKKTTTTTTTTTTPAPTYDSPLYLTTTPVLLPTEPELPLYLTTTEYIAEEETTSTSDHLPLYLTTTEHYTQEETTSTSDHLPLYLTTTPLLEGETTTSTSHLPLYMTTTQSQTEYEYILSTASSSSTRLPLYMTTTPLPEYDTSTRTPLYMTTTESLDTTKEPTEYDTTSTEAATSSTRVPLYMTTTELPEYDTTSSTTKEATEYDTTTQSSTTSTHIPLYMTTTEISEYDTTSTTSTTRRGASGSVPTSNVQTTAEMEESTSSTSNTDTIEGTSSTSSTMDISSTRTTIFKEAYCECASAESWDDYHYLDENGDIVTVAKQNEVEVIIDVEDDNDVDDVKVPMLNGKETGEKKVGAYNSMLVNEGTQCSSMHIIVVIMCVSYWMCI